MITTTTSEDVTASNPSPAGQARTIAELDRQGTGSHEVYTAGFYPSGWDYVVRSLLGKAGRSGADAGEVLATIAQIKPDDRNHWCAAWSALGSRLLDVAGSCARHGHRISASRAYLRSANYLAVAVNALNGARNSKALRSTFRLHRTAWEGFLDSTRWPLERVEIPYQGTTLPGWFFRPDSSTGPRPTLVVNNGSDGALSGVWCECAEAGLERGYNVMMFDGPGQQSMLFDRGVAFRPDWEQVLTPVTDFIVEREDVDAHRLAVYGVSQAGYWVPRALAFEHRFAAAVVDGGVVDVSRSWFANIPRPLLDLYRDGKKDQFDQLMADAMQQYGGAAAHVIWNFRAAPYGASGYSAVLDAVSQYALTDVVAAQISTPLYIVDPDGEQFFPGQSAELAALTPTATLARFTQEEGASYHCQPMARELTEQRMFDWLDDQLSDRGH